jgi:hypothetical protein
VPLRRERHVQQRTRRPRRAAARRRAHPSLQQVRDARGLRAVLWHGRDADRARAARGDQPRDPDRNLGGRCAAIKKQRVANIENVVANRIKTPETQQYVVLDSATYKGENPDTITNIKKWDIEIIKAELQGLDAIRKVITDYELDIARMLGVEFVFVGGGDTAGTYGMHESKVSLFGAQLGSDSALVAAQLTELGRRLVAANGLDPDDAAPTFVPSPISTEDILKVAQTLVQLGLAGLPPNHPAKKQMFERLNLTWEDEPEPVMPRIDPTGGPGGGPAASRSRLQIPTCPIAQHLTRSRSRPMSEVVTIGGSYTATIYGTVALATNYLQTKFGDRYTTFLAKPLDDQKRASSPRPRTSTVSRGSPPTTPSPSVTRCRRSRTRATSSARSSSRTTRS